MVLPVMKPGKNRPDRRVEIFLPSGTRDAARAHNGGSGAFEAARIGWKASVDVVSSRLCLDGRDLTDVLGALRLPRIVSGLHSGPDSRSVAKKLAEPHRHGRGYRLFFLEDIVKMLPRNPDQS